MAGENRSEVPTVACRMISKTEDPEVDGEEPQRQQAQNATNDEADDSKSEDEKNTKEEGE